MSTTFVMRNNRILALSWKEMQAVFLAFMWKQMWAEDGFFYLFYGETSFQLPFLFKQKALILSNEAV